MSSEPQQEGFHELRRRGDNPSPLAHRTDRIALQNRSSRPTVFVDDDPLFFLAEDPESVRNDPMKTGVADIRTQHYPIEVGDHQESEAAIRELVEQFDADTDRQFYYVLAGDEAQINGNGLDDYFEAIENFRTTYEDLRKQMKSRGESESESDPLDQYVRVACVGLTSVEGFWLQFTTWLSESPDAERYTHTSLSVTSVEQHGPLATMWLQDRLDHPTLGSPSAVDRRRTQSQVSLSLGPGPLRDVKECRLIGYRGRDETVEYVSCENPYYRSGGSEWSDLFNRLEERGMPSDVIRGVLGVDRLLLRPRGGSHGVDEDLYINGEIQVTRFGTPSGSGTGGVTLFSGKCNPVRENKYAELKETREAEREKRNKGFLHRITP